LRRADGETIAYLQRDGKQPSVVWLGGFKSDMRGNKADAIDAWAEAQSRAFLRFDYYGHGESSGDFRNGTIGRWRDDALAVIDEVTDGPLVLAASSMGAWIALLAGRARPDRIRAMLLLAPAADFTEALMWARMTPDIRRQILKEGEWLRPSAYDDGPYPITRGLIEDGRAHLVLHAPIALACPVHIVHGMKDPDVPWEHALTLMDRLSGDPRLTLVKNGDHRLSKPGDLRLICDTLETLVA
jgi:pimeloyl-ACP methyl ester carboxylesterase